MKRVIAVALLGLSLSGCGSGPEYYGDGDNPMPVYLDGGSKDDLCERGETWACHITEIHRIGEREVLIETTLYGNSSTAKLIADKFLEANPDIDKVKIHDSGGYAVEYIWR